MSKSFVLSTVRKVYLRHHPRPNHLPPSLALVRIGVDLGFIHECLDHLSSHLIESEVTQVPNIHLLDALEDLADLAAEYATGLFRHEVQVGVREVFIRDPPLNGTEQVLKLRGPPHLSLDEIVTLLHTLC